MSEFRESLRDNGYARVRSEIQKADLASTMEAYLNFLELGERYFEITRFYMTDRGDGDFGQFRREAGQSGERGIVQDTKDIFHFGAQTRQVVETRAQRRLPNSMRVFLRDAEEIFWTAERAKLNALEELDVMKMGLERVMMHERAQLNDVLRFIAYYPDPNKLAKGHFDRSVCTLALGESHEGLRIAPGQNGMQRDVEESYMNILESHLTPVEHVSGEAKFFLGAGWNRLAPQLRFGNQDMPLGWHDVVSSHKSVNERVMRWAVVLFANPHLGVEDYAVPSPPETRPYKKFGRILLDEKIPETLGA